jgi:transcription elongation factor Elf1
MLGSPQADCKVIYGGEMNKGTKEMTCDYCGAFNVVHYTDHPVQDKGVVRCAVCGDELLHWKGTRVYGKAELKGQSN